MAKCVIIDPVTDPIRVVSEATNAGAAVKTVTPTAGKPVPRKD